MDDKFNLSEKREFDRRIELYEYPKSPYHYSEDDVKEFIKRLKEEVKFIAYPISGIIDKLAGDKLNG